MAGVSVDQFRDGSGVAAASTRRAVLPAALFFTFGFATVFVALGAGASSIGLLLRQHLDLLSRFGGIIIIVMGLHFLGVFRIGLLAREARFQGGKPATLSGAYVMGEASHTPESLAIADLKFHLSVIEASGNPFLRTVGGLIEAALVGVFKLSSPTAEKGGIDEVARNHIRIVEAIGKRDEAAARLAMEHVIKVGRARIRQALGGSTAKA